MQAVVADAVAGGAMGFASSAAPTHQGDAGRPVPSRHADLSEFQALADAVASTGRGIVQLLPGDNLRLGDVYDIQRRTRRPVTWTALLTAPGGRHRRAAERNRLARAEGADVWPQMAVRPLVFQFDMREPFTFDTVPIFAELHAQPESVRRERFADAGWRAAAQDALDHGPVPPRFDSLLIAETDSRPDLIGRSVGEVAAERGVAPLEVMLELSLAEDLNTRFRGVLANDDPDEIAELLKDDGLIIGLSDAGAHASQLCDACFSTELLGTFVREREAIPIETGVHKLTGQLAGVLGLADRGVLRPGALADIAVFDPDTVAPGPLRRVHDLPAGADRLVADQPSGITHVVVNGVPIRADGEPVADGVEQRPGRIVRS